MASEPKPGELKVGATSGLVPVPDPTVLTTAALLREIDGLRERTTHDNNMLRQLVEARLDANDESLKLLRTLVEKEPTLIGEAVASLRLLHEEKFNSIGIQFKERDVRTDQTSRDSKVAVDAALKAQQEAFAEQNKSSALAISKSEAATTKQMDLIVQNIANLAKSIDDKIADIKDRLTSMESRAQGVTVQKQETIQSTTQNWSYIVGVTGFLIGFGGLAIALLRH